MARKPISAHDVAAYIVENLGSVTAMKLQKLVYYSQAWSLVWDEAPLFHEEVEAWRNGPMVYTLYDAHRRRFSVNKWPRGDAEKLSSLQAETVDTVLDYYGDHSPQFLSDLSHQEEPWGDAGEGVPEGASGNAEITHAAMAEYYGSLPPDEDPADAGAA